jgi:hypothetical protein
MEADEEAPEKDKPHKRELLLKALGVHRPH